MNFFKKKNDLDMSVNTDPQKAGLKQILGKRLRKITFSYFGIMALGITIFVFAKKDVDKNRQNLMKLKQELNQSDDRYPNRMDLIRQEKNKE